MVLEFCSTCSSITEFYFNEVYVKLQLYYKGRVGIFLVLFCVSLCLKLVFAVSFIFSNCSVLLLEVIESTTPGLAVKRMYQ